MTPKSAYTGTNYSYGATTTPYSTQNSSSTPTAPADYFRGGGNNVVEKNTDSGIDWNQWGILIAGIILSGMVSYFVTLMAVKEDIAQNSKDISVVNEKLNNVSSGLVDMKSSVKDMEINHKNIGILEVKIDSLTKEMDKQSSQIERNQQVLINKNIK